MNKSISFFFFISMLVIPTITIGIGLFAEIAPEVQAEAISTDINREKLTAEEDNTDSFTVHPDGGRWNTTTDTLADNRIIDSNYRLITSTNSTSTASQYYMQRPTIKTDSKIEYRYRAGASGNQSEYFRDQGDSVDFEEGDVEGATGGSVSNGIWSISGASNPAFTFASGSRPYINFNAYTSLQIRAKTNLTTASNFYTYFLGGNNNLICTRNIETAGITNEWKVFTINLTAKTTCNYPGTAYTNQYQEKQYIYQFFPLASNAIFYIDYIKITGIYDYATHQEGAIEDTWDFEDSLDYFYDTLGNISDFDDGSKEGFIATGSNTLTNYNTQMLQINRSSGGYTHFSVYRQGLSIAASTYKYFAMEFKVDQYTTVNITIYNTTNAVACVASTTYTANQWNLFTCDLSSGSWSGTETKITIEVSTSPSWSTTYGMYINSVYIYDTSLGDTDGFKIASVFDYIYVDPTGYLVTAPADSGSTAILFPDPTYFQLDTSVYRYFTIRAKTSAGSPLFRLATSLGTFLTGASATLSTSFQTFTFDLALDTSNWIDSNAFFRYYLQDESGNFEGDERLIIDYILLTADNIAQDFTFGFIDTSDNPLLNISHHFFNASTFRWEIEMFDSAGDLASYYYTSNYTSTDPGFAAVDTTLAVDGWSNTTDDWIEQGSSPYLDAVDTTNNITISNADNVTRWFTFADQGSSHTDSFTVTLDVYVLEADGDDDLAFQIDTSGDNTPECIGQINNPVFGWNSYSLTCITTDTNIDATRVSFIKKTTATANNITLDAARLSVTHASTLVGTTCKDEFCTIIVSYNILESELGVQIYDESHTRLYNLDWRDDFTTSNNRPTLFGIEIAPEVYFDSITNFIGSMEIWLDYITAPFAENLFNHYNRPSNTTYWTTDDRFTQMWTDGTVANQTSSYRLNVPRLDSLSGVFSAIYSNFTNWSAGNPNMEARIGIYNVAKSDGDLYPVLQMRYNIYASPTLWMDVSIHSRDTVTPTDWGGADFTFGGLQADGSVSFSLGLTENRDKATLALIYNTNITDASPVIYAFAKNQTVSEGVTDASQEFVIELWYKTHVLNAGSGRIVFGVSDFAYVEKDIFSDVLWATQQAFGIACEATAECDQATANTLKSMNTKQDFADPLTTLFRELQNAVTGLGNTIIDGLKSAFQAIIDGLQAALTVVINALGTVFSTVIGWVVDAVNGLVTWLSNILDELLALAADIWTALIDVITDVLDTIVSNILQFIKDVIGVILSFLPWGIGDFIANFMTLNILTVMSNIFNMVLWVLGISVILFVLFLGFHMFVFPIWSNLGNQGAIPSAVAHNAFKFHGMDYNTSFGTIPLKLNAFIVWMVMITILGYLSWIWPGGNFF